METLGILAALGAALAWGSQFAPLKIGNIAGREPIFPISLGIFMTGALIFLLSRTRFNKEDITGGILSGLIWSIGNLLALTSVSMIGLAKGVPISQVAVLVAVLWGLFYFKEVTRPRHRIQVLIGALILLTGVIILSLA